MRPPVACGSECEVSRRSDTLAVRNGVREDASAADSGRFRAGIVGFQAPGFCENPRIFADFRGFFAPPGATSASSAEATRDTIDALDLALHLPHLTVARKCVRGGKAAPLAPPWLPF